MVYYGKHIIDPKTGLCEICDRSAIYDFRQGKRSGKQFFYSNQDGKFTYRPFDEETRHNHEEITPRYVRKPLYPEPPPARTRQVIHEEPVLVQKKVPRGNRSPLDDIQNGSPGRLTTLYYVDNTGQMNPRNEIPSDEPRRRHPVQTHQSPSTRPARIVQRRAQTPPMRSARVVQRRAQTPPPPASESWRSPRKRQTNSDTEIIQQPYTVQQNDPYYNQSPRKAEMFHIDKPHSDNRYPPMSSIVHASHDNNSPPVKTLYQGDTNKKQRQLEPIERKHYTEAEPTVIRKVYKKLPAKKYEPQEEEYIPNGNHLRPARKIEKIYPSPRTHQPSAHLTNTYIKSPLPNNQASVYYIRSADEY